MDIQSEYHGYFLTERIKQNEDGTVYIGQNGEAAASERIIKVFNTQLILLRDRQRFLQEVSMLTSLRHPVLIPLLDIGLDKGRPYLIREYAPEGSLITQLAQQEGFAFPLPTLMDILTRIGSAITYLHQEQVYHGSVKPENILFNANKQALLADIHIASIHPNIPSTASKPILTGKGPILREQSIAMPDDPKSKMQQDIYALSSIAYELLTGYQPFKADAGQDVAPVPPSHWTASLSRRVDQVFLQALSPYAEDRFDNATLFVEALRSAFTMSAKEQTPLLVEQQTISQTWQKQLVPVQTSFNPKALEVSTSHTPRLQSSFGHNLLEEFARLGSQLFAWLFANSQVSGRRRSGGNVFSIRLLLIILALLIVLVSIRIPAFLFRLPPNPPASHTAQNQIRQVGHTATVSQSKLTATYVHNQTLTPIPTPDPTPVPLPTLVNASFEAPIFSGDYEYAPNDSGWTFSDDCGIASNGSSLTQGTDNAPWGAQVAFVQAYGTIYQNISFTKGTYIISLLAAQRVNSSSTQSLLILIDNTVVSSFSPVGGHYLSYSTYSFTVDTGIHTLEFKGLKGGAHNTIFIDSVSLSRG